MDVELPWSAQLEAALATADAAAGVPSKSAAPLASLTPPATAPSLPPSGVHTANTPYGGVKRTLRASMPAPFAGYAVTPAGEPGGVGNGSVVSVASAPKAPRRSVEGGGPGSFPGGTPVVVGGAPGPVRAPAGTPGYLAELNTAQLAAAAAPLGEPLLVLAGPGSGKTFTLQKRIQHIVTAGAVRPGGVLAITFTRSAAEELRARVARDLGAPAARAMVIGTFHSFGMKLCRAFLEELGGTGRSREFLLAGSGEQVAILTTALRLHEGKVAAALGARGGTAPLPDTHVVGSAPPKLLGVASSVAELDARRKKLARRIAGHLACLRSGTPGAGDARLPTLLADRGWPPVAWFLDHYVAALEALNMLDFGELISLALAALTTLPAARAWVTDRFKYLLVDEFQDTSVTQYRLVAAVGRLLGGRVTVVGDDDQSIYGFQGASVANFGAFSSDFGREGGGAQRPVARVALVHNYRSTPTVVGACTALISALRTRRMAKSAAPVRGALPHTAVPARGGEDMTPELLEAAAAAAAGSAPVTAEPRVEVLTGALRVVRCENVRCEAAEVADAVARFRAAGYAFKDIALLSRRRLVGWGMAKLLRERGLPVREAAAAVFARGDARGAWAVLATCANPHNDAAFVGALLALMKGSKRPLSEGLAGTLRRVAHSGRTLEEAEPSATHASGAGTAPGAAPPLHISLYDLLSTFSSAPREWREEEGRRDRVPVWADVQCRLLAVVKGRLGFAAPPGGWGLHASSVPRTRGRGLARLGDAASAEAAALGAVGAAAWRRGVAKARALWEALRGGDLDACKGRVVKLEGAAARRHEAPLVQFVEEAVGLLPHAKGNGFLAARAASRGGAPTAAWRAGQAQSASARRRGSSGFAAAAGSPPRGGAPPAAPCLVDAMVAAAEDFQEVWEEERLAMAVPDAGGGAARDAFAVMAAKAALAEHTLDCDAVADRLHSFVNHVAGEIDGAEYRRAGQERLARGGKRRKRGAAKDGDAVWAGTIHQAKGLEWPCVILLRANEGELPIAVGGGGGGGEEGAAGDALDDERRVAYVALSRARDHIVATYLHRLTGGREGTLSHFFSAIPAGLQTELVRDNVAHPARHLDGTPASVPAAAVPGVAGAARAAPAPPAGVTASLASFLTPHGAAPSM